MKNELAYQRTHQASEKEVEDFLDTIQNLLEMSAFNCEYLRRKIEKQNPFFMELIQKFLVIELAKHESLMNICHELSTILKEFWAAKFAKGGEA